MGDRDTAAEGPFDATLPDPDRAQELWPPGWEVGGLGSVANLFGRESVISQE